MMSFVDLRWARLLPVAFATVCAVAAGAMGAVVFQDIGTLGGPASSARGVSLDGTVVVGDSRDGSGNTQAYVWDGTAVPTPTMTGLGFPPDVESYSSAAAVDAWSDGSQDVLLIAVRGHYYDFFFDETKNQTFLWMGSADGTSWQPAGPWYTWYQANPGAYFQAILMPGNDWTDPNGIAVVGNETFITGYGRKADWVPGSNNYYHGYRWRSGDLTTYDGETIQYSMLDLLYPKGSTLPSYGNDISKFGQIVGQVQYGSSNPGSGSRQAFYWQAGTYTLIPTLVGPSTTSNEAAAKAVSADGSTAVGWSKYPDCPAGYRQPFHWKKGSATSTAIPFIGTDNYGEATAVNGYGSLIAGYMRTDAEWDKLFLWDETNGTRYLSAVLTDAGVDLTGWILTEVTDISLDGSVIVGNGLDPAADSGTGTVVQGAPTSTLEDATKSWASDEWLGYTCVIGTEIYGIVGNTNTVLTLAAENPPAGSQTYEIRRERGWVVTGMPAFAPPVPVIAEVTPDPTATNIGAEYKVQLVLNQGTLPAPTWSVVSILSDEDPPAPPNAGGGTLQVNSSGLVFGWTPQPADLGKTFTITIRATNVTGFDDETWAVQILNTGPTVMPILYPNGTSVTVSSINGASNNITRVTLFRDRYNSGTDLWEEVELAYADASSTPPLATNATSYTFTLAAGDLQHNDVIKATQHRGTIESDVGTRWRIVVDGPPWALTKMNWTAAANQLTKVGGFVSYTWQSGDVILITGGTNVTKGTYTIVSKDSDDAITLGTSIVGADVTDSSVSGNIHRSPLPYAAWGFSDDFELPYVQPFWQPEEVMTLTSEQSRGSQALLENYASGGRLAVDAASGIWNAAVMNAYPVVFEFWMYEDGDGIARHVGGIMDCNGGGYNIISSPATIPLYLFEIGCLPTVSPPGETTTFADSTRYQFRVLQARPNNPAVAKLNFSDNLDEGRCPNRSPGWHRFSIKMGEDATYFYVDGQVGYSSFAGFAPSINNMYLGTWSGNDPAHPLYGCYTYNTVTQCLDGRTAYYDDVSLRQVANNPVVMSIPMSPDPALEVEAPLNQPFSYTVNATDNDTPDTAILTITSVLPDWLTATPGLTDSNSPTASITIQGTPTVAGQYIVSFQAKDDLSDRAGGARTADLIINVTSSCDAPTIDTMTPAAGVQGTGNRTYYTDTVPPGPTPPAGKIYYVDAAPLKVVITGTNFVDGGTTVKLVAQSPPVGGEAELTVTPTTVTTTQIDGTVDLTGSFPGSLDGVWDLVVTTCDSATKTGAFTVSMCFPARQDTDGDGDVDLGDFSSVFQACFNGPNRPYKLSWPFNKDCACMDVHEPLGTPAENDVDLSDFTAFQGCFNGPNRPPKLGC